MTHILSSHSPLKTSRHRYCTIRTGIQKFHFSFALQSHLGSDWGQSIRWAGREATLGWRNRCVDFPRAWALISKKDALVQAYSNCKTLFQVCSPLVSIHQYLNDSSLEENCLVPIETDHIHLWGRTHHTRIFHTWRRHWFPACQS